MRNVSVLLVLMLSPSFVLGADILVVCPPAFRNTLKPWIQHREEQGLSVQMLSNNGSTADIRKVIRSAAGAKTKYLLLIGDADPRMAEDQRIRAVSVPTHFIDAKVNIHWADETDIASDNAYADLDDDGLPDLAAGRWPVDTKEELRTVVDKVLAYEQNRDFGLWRRRISFVGCPGNFGQVIDSVIEQRSRKLTTEGIPASFATTGTYGNWRSPYCPDPRRFGEVARMRLCEGSLFWVYIGHGHCRVVDSVQTPDKQKFPILHYDDIASLDCSSGHPIAMFLACYTGMFDHANDSIAEEMLRTKGAPVAVISSTRVTMPYAMTVMGGEMMKEYFVRRSATLGELFKNAKRNMVLAERTDPTAKMLDSLALAMNPKSPDLKAERAEHVEMFHLIGDPTLKLSHPETILVQPLGPGVPGTDLVVKATSPIAGRCLVELVPPRDKLPMKPAPRNDFVAADSLFAELDQTYDKVNSPALATADLSIPSGAFEVKLHVPESLSGKAFVRIYVEGEESFAVGDAEVEVNRQQASVR